MATFDDLRRLAIVLPGAAELTYRGEPWFNVGKKTFALAWNGRTILKLDKTHQIFLFEVRPETFQRFPMGPERLELCRARPPRRRRTRRARAGGVVTGGAEEGQPAGAGSCKSPDMTN